MITLSDLLAGTGGTLHGQAVASEFADFCYDSRILHPGELFLAVVTETGDGHDYIAAACAAGAAGVVCQRAQGVPDGVTCVVVENTQQALLDYARHVLATRRIEVIGITGSVGKTSAKEAIAAVLGASGAVFRNRGNLNGRYGLPIALGQLQPEQHLAVLEMAADSLDEIRDLAEIVRPRVGVVTDISASHLETFGSLEAIAREKGRLVEALPEDGLAILNDDVPLVRALALRTRARVFTYGTGSRARLYADDVRVTPQGTHLTAHYRDACVALFVPLIGAQHVGTALAACAVGLDYGLSWEEIRRGLAAVEPLPGRTRLLAGLHGSQVLDDSYNASPTSTAAALETLRALPAERRLVLLGDMAELGAAAEAAHREVGRACARVADLLVTKGEWAQRAAAEALRAGMSPEAVHVTYTAEDATRLLARELSPGDLLLVKGSATARLESVTSALLAEPERADAVLPRQSRGWTHVRLERPGRPTWVEVDLEAIAHNVRRIVQHVGPRVDVLAVLKADGYGHGAAKVAHTALHSGATWLGVACLGEAQALRHAGLSAPILILGFTPAWQARAAVLDDIRVTVFSTHVAEALSRAAQAVGRVARVHVKVDTGMGRLGLLPEETLPFVRQLAHLPGLQVEGIFTHMASADETDLSYTRWQLARFDAVLAPLAAEGLLPPCVHAANSACLLRLPESHYTMVRPGIALFGIDPSPE
ncbi:MAG: alanine racemase, partial [Chloroflexi bacterium]|nr:alanine racemase [Chloroflexota bacterium]